jgi:hypothetical protein
MKKFASALLCSALIASGGIGAQESAGGANASNNAFGEMSEDKIIAGTMIAGILVGVASNAGGAKTFKPIFTPNPPVDPEPELTCMGDDDLVDGICIGTTTTSTVTTSGTVTSTIFVPVTYTYLPTLQ